VLVVGVGFVCWVVVFGFGGCSFAGFYFDVDEISTPCLHVSRRQPGCIACGPEMVGSPLGRDLWSCCVDCWVLFVLLGLPHERGVLLVGASNLLMRKRRTGKKEDDDDDADDDGDDDDGDDV